MHVDIYNKLGVIGSSMEGQSQRIVLAHDASRGVRVNSMRSVLERFLMKAGDTFTVVFIVHQIRHPSMFLVIIILHLC